MGALILVQAGATSIAGYVALRDARQASDELYSYVSTVTIERVSTFVDPATTMADTIRERTGNPPPDGDGLGPNEAPAIDLPAIDMPVFELPVEGPSSTEGTPSAASVFDVQDLLSLIRPVAQVASAMVAYPDGGYAAVSREGDGYVVIMADPGSGQEVVSRFGPGLHIQSTETRPRSFEPTESVWYTQGSASSAVQWLEPSRSDLTGGAVVGVSMGSFERDGTLSAVVLVEIDIAALSAYLTGLPLGGDGEAFILSADRRVVAAPLAYQDTVSRVEKETGMAPTAEDLGLGDSGTAANGVYEDGDYRVLETRFSGDAETTWTLQLRADASQLSPGLTAFQRTLTWYFTVLAALTVFSGFVIIWLRKPMLRLKAHASTDPLTGLANRREFALRGEQIVDAAVRRHEHVVVMMMDLDRLKSVNDRLGHAQGDAVIRAAAEALGEVSNSRDLAARLGGDEFALIRWLAPGEDAETVAEDVRRRVADRVREIAGEGDDADDGVGASIGFAVGGNRRDTLTRLLDRADDALIAGKQVGRGATYAAPGSPT